MTLPPANETITPHPEPYGIFGTQCQHKPGDVISDELGNWYKVTETSTYCAEIRLYNTPAELVKPANLGARC
jgi:hypothetical protein